MGIAAVIGTEDEPKLKFYSLGSEEPVDRVFEFDQVDEFTYQLSPILRMPVAKTGNYKAATVFTFSEGDLRRRIDFYLVAKTDKGMYKLVGVAESVERDLWALLVDQTKKKLFLPVRNHPSFKLTGCQLEL